jgi:hypothetical protein
MKKIIALLVVFALFAGSVFAVDLGGAVNGHVSLFSGTTEDGKDEITASADMGRIRIEGAGQTDDGVFGGWLRKEAGESGANGIAWWKPLDVLKISIGGNPDGHWGKEGVTGWMFSQTAYDSAPVTVNTGNIWGWGMYGFNTMSRTAFFGGSGRNALRLEITPLDILAINIDLPVFDGGEWEDLIKGAVAQVDLNLAFGNIALTYQGGASQIGDNGRIFGYLGMPLGIINLDVGFALAFADPDKPSGDDSALPIAAGIGLKAGISDLFGIKLRTWAAFGGKDAAGDATPFILTADLNPYLTLSDSLRVFFTLGMAMSAPSEGDSTIGFHINPYIEVGQEWGPKFLAGFTLVSDGSKDAKDNGIITWGLGIGIQSSF